MSHSSRARGVGAPLDAGVVWINHYNGAPVTMPFGGRKISGLDRENGKTAIGHCREMKSIYVALDDIDPLY